MDSSGLNTNALINVIDRLLERDQSLVKMIDETREDVQRSEIEVKKYLQKSEMLENENELKDRKIGQSLQRNGFLRNFKDLYHPILFIYRTKLETEISYDLYRTGKFA